MKVRTLAVLSILSLAAWLPMQAQQPAAPAAPAAQSPAPAAPDNSAKPQAKGDCCCASMAGCCHGKTPGDANASCCAGKDAKEMPCCAQKTEAGKSAMNCCQGMKDAECAAKGDKACCRRMNAKDAKPCCKGMGGQCPARAAGK